MYIFRYLTVILILSTLICCETEFLGELQLKQPTIVIEGWITDLDEPQRILVSRSIGREFSDKSDWNIPSGDLIDDAKVIISSTSQSPDTLMLAISKDENNSDKWYGYYFTNNIKGIVGEKYFLRVEYEGKIYEAEAFMPPVPPIDSISYGRKQVEKENAILTVPLVNFTDPADEENYYLFRTGFISTYHDESGNEVEGWSINRSTDPWLISIFNDDYLNGAYSTLNTREGITTDAYWRDGNFWHQPGNRFFIQMQSITKEAYNYYKALINQLNYTAGVFHPTPASPPTNISNGGQGFFGASSIVRAASTIPAGQTDNY
jgi:hypothetical protein